MSTATRKRSTILAVLATAATVASGCALLQPPPVTSGGPPPTAADLGAPIGAVAIDDTGATAAAVSGDRAKLIDKASEVVTDIGGADAGSSIEISGDGSRTFWVSGGNLTGRLDASGTATIVPGVERWASSGDGNAVVASTAAMLDPSDTDGGSSVYLVGVDSGIAIWLGPVPGTDYTLDISDDAAKVLVANDPADNFDPGFDCVGSTANVLDVATVTWSTAACGSSQAQLSGDGSRLWIPRTICQLLDDCIRPLVAVELASGTEVVVQSNTARLAIDSAGGSGVFRWAERGMIAFNTIWQLGGADGSLVDLSYEAPLDPTAFPAPFPADTEFAAMSDDGTVVVAQRGSGGTYDTEVAQTDGTVLFTAAVGTAAPTAADPLPVLSGDGSTVAVPAGSILTIDD